jgi:hypothetical protein
MRRLIASAALSLSLIASSTMAVASTGAPPAHVPSPWLTLSMLSPSSAAALDATAVAAAQPDTGAAQPEAPPAPPPPPQSGRFVPPPIPVLAVWLAVLATDIWILARNNKHNPTPNSPA